MPDLAMEIAAGGIVAGVDEAGRGPWAGPVVAAAVVLDAARLPDDLAAAIDDSKALSRPRRERVFALLPSVASIGVGAATVAEIDQLNILQATLLAMQRAIADLGVVADLVLVDGKQVSQLAVPARAVVDGDAKSLSIAAASIVAKVTRDRLMVDLDRQYPGYGWERNAGYGTAEHRAALARLGPSPEHRRSFRPVRAYFGG